MNGRKQYCNYMFIYNSVRIVITTKYLRLYGFHHTARSDWPLEFTYSRTVSQYCTERMHVKVWLQPYTVVHYDARIKSSQEFVYSHTILNNFACNGWIICLQHFFSQYCIANSNVSKAALVEAMQFLNWKSFKPWTALRTRWHPSALATERKVTISKQTSTIAKPKIKRNQSLKRHEVLNHAR